MAKRAKASPEAAPKGTRQNLRGTVRKRSTGGRTARAAQATVDPRLMGRRRDVAAIRELFWQNVMREILTNLSVVSGRKASLTPTPAPAPEPGVDGRGQGADLVAPAEAEASEEMELFDGRLAVITRQGQRVAIAEVFPLFACGIATPAERRLSMEVECTVFQIRTPNGEVFTLPLDEMRAFHALTPELMQKLERAARRQARRRGEPRDREGVPFGFAAFTSLAQGEPSIVPQAPPHPTE